MVPAAFEINFPVTRFSWIFLDLFMCLARVEHMVKVSGKPHLEVNLLRDMKGNEKDF